METWVFWLLIVVILALAAVIIIRDKGIRAKILGIFTAVRKKIRIARLKARIKKETEALDELLTGLGEEAWRQEVDNPGTADQIRKLTEINSQKVKLDQEVERMNKEIEDEKNIFETFEKKQKEFVKEQEDKSEPLEKEVGSLKKELGELEKGINEQKKIGLKLDKKIAAREKKIIEIKQDEDLSNIEKDEKTKEEEAEILEINSQLEQAGEMEKSLSVRDPELKDKIAQLEPRVSDFHKKITELKDEMTIREKSMKEKVEETRKNRNTLVGDIALKKKEIEELFSSLGGNLDKDRIDNKSLLPYYSKIDNQKKLISNLEKQLGPDNKESN